MAWFGSTLVRVGLLIGSSAVGYIAGQGSLKAAPANDDFANRTALTGVTNFIVASNAGASLEQGESDHAGGEGGSSVWWTWTAPVSGSFSISTAGSTFDTLLGVYFDSSLTNLISIVSDDDSAGNGASVVVFRAIAGETYNIAVDGFLGATGDITLSIGPSGYAQPAWTLRNLNLYPVASTSYQNKVLLLDFFETTCGACIDETPDLITLHHQRASAGFEIVAVAKDALTPSQIAYNATTGLKIDYTVLLNNLSVESSFGGPLALPTKFLIDREGKVQMALVGGHSLAYYDSVIAPLMRGAVNLPVKIRRVPGQIILSWPATEFYAVESSTQPSGGTWNQLTLFSTIINDENTVSIQTTSSLRSFFRLRKL